jgi:serine/threonine protein kinase
MSPEQTRGEILDTRSDLFSLGCVLYEAATRTLPFGGPNVLSIMHAIAATDPPPPSRVRAELSREFDMIIERALAKDKDRRYPSASEMARALSSLRESTARHWSGFPIVYDMECSVPSFVGRTGDERRGFPATGNRRNAHRLYHRRAGIGKTSISDEFPASRAKQYSGLMISRDDALSNTALAKLTFSDAAASLLNEPGRE